MAKIIVHLGEQEREALRTLAKRDLRDPRAPAAFIIRQEIEVQGAWLEQEDLSRTKGSVFCITRRATMTPLPALARKSFNTQHGFHLTALEDRISFKEVHDYELADLGGHHA